MSDPYQQFMVPLKSCPCCGAEARYRSSPGDWGYTKAELTIACTRCPLRCGPVQFPTDSLYHEETWKLLSEKWNRRDG